MKTSPDLFDVQSAFDGVRLSAALFSPAAGVKGVVQFVHGMCEHKERYFPLMEWLCGKGYACVIHDHRGHGASVRDKEDLGFMYEGGWTAMVEDVKTVGDLVREKFPGQPFALFGHSMGSMVVRSYVKRYDDTIDRLFVCGSPSDNPAKGIGKFLASLYGCFKGWHYRPGLLQALSFGQYNKAFRNEGYRNAWVCSNREILETYSADPLCSFVFTANGFHNLMGLMQDCYGKRGWVMKNPSLPVHFVSGSEDPCRISDKAFGQAVEFMRERGYSNTDACTYPGMRHEIHNEVDRQIVWNDILKKL